MVFSIKSEIYDKLKPRFEKAKELILAAIEEGRPIIVRHHADCDGYASALCLDQAITPLVIKAFPNLRNLNWQFLRVPNYTPFLQYSDILRDLAFIDPNKKSSTPLVIVTDTGSTAESIFAYRKYKAFGVQVIVIDHHVTHITDGKSEVEDEIAVHINPHLVGGGSNICAGMLCFEQAQLFRKNPNVHIPAIAGIADWCDGPEYDQYMELAKQKFTEEELDKISQAIDFEAYHVRGDGKGLINALFGTDKGTVLHNATLITDEYERRCVDVRERIAHYAKMEEHGKYVIVTLELGPVRHREYPADGKCASLASEMAGKKYPGKGIVVLGYTEETITFRVDGVQGFDLNHIIDDAKKSFPYGKVSGGGHAVAGTVRFNPDLHAQMMQKCKEYTKSLYR